MKADDETSEKTFNNLSVTKHVGESFKIYKWLDGFNFALRNLYSGCRNYVLYVERNTDNK